MVILLAATSWLVSAETLCAEFHKPFPRKRLPSASADSVDRSMAALNHSLRAFLRAYYAGLLRTRPHRLLTVGSWRKGSRLGRPARAYRITVAGWQVIRLGGSTAGSGRCGWPGPVRPRPLPAGPGTSGSTGYGSSLRMPCGPVMRCGCAATDVNASWSSSRSSPSVSVRRLPPGATSTTALPLRPARRLSRWLSGTAALAGRPSASAGASRSCSGGRPADACRIPHRTTPRILWES